MSHWFAGEPEIASRLWHELFTVAPTQPADSTLPPSAQAFQLDAKARASEDPHLGTVQFALPEGWTAQIDGTALTNGEDRVAAGRRILRLSGPEDASVGSVLAVGANATVLVGTAQGLQDDVLGAKPNPQSLEWLGGLLAPLVSQQGAAAALVVNLDTDPPSVRRFKGVRSLVLTTGKGRRSPGARVSSAASTSGPHPGSVALLGGGLAATVIGVIVAAVANRDGAALQGVESMTAYGDAYAPYEAARTREQVGTGLAIGGGVLAVAGAVTFVIPQKTKPKAKVAAR